MTSRPDRATAEKFTKTLRELIKRPENKVCADCKRNDPRWASWNLGVFLCIRCSGIHRGMGTHISKVKSIDLDMWTPEQMESIQKWGNNRANLYWEAHLKAGHVPPEHKMESFIRSKYESKRWAMEGPIPTDPSVLESHAAVEHAEPPVPVAAPVAQSAVSQVTSQATTTLSVQPTATRQTQLLSANLANQLQQKQQAAPAPAAPVAPPAQPKPLDDLFTLDFHAPATSNPHAQQQPKKDVKQDILSLFSVAPTAPTAGLGGLGGSNQAAQPSHWGIGQVQQQASAPVSMVGNTGVGAWGVNSGWTNPTGAAPAALPGANASWGNPLAPSSSSGLWGNSTQQPANVFASSNDTWGGSTVADPWASSASTTTSTTTAKKDDVFGDIWSSLR